MSDDLHLTGHHAVPPRAVPSATDVARAASAAGKARWPRLTPMPTAITAAPPAALGPAAGVRLSRRMPAILRPPTRRSFGHLSRALMPATRARASATASA